MGEYVEVTSPSGCVCAVVPVCGLSCRGACMQAVRARTEVALTCCLANAANLGGVVAPGIWAATTIRDYSRNKTAMSLIAARGCCLS